MAKLIKTVVDIILKVIRQSVMPAQNSIKPVGTLDYEMVDAIVRAKAEEIQDKDYDIFIPDSANKVYGKVDVVASQALKEVSSIKYIDEKHDCDDFAAILFGKFAGLIWTNTHSFNWFIDETDTFWYIEPQTGQLSQIIEGWQGNDIRFFLGR